MRWLGAVLLTVILCTGHPLAQVVDPLESDGALLMELSARADSLSDLGRYPEAIQVSLRRLALIKSLYGPKNPRRAEAMISLGTLYSLAGDYLHAVSMYEEAVPIYKEHYGGLSRELATALDNLGMQYFMLGAFDRAAGPLAEALETRQLLLSAKDPLLAQSCNNVAGLYIATGNDHRAIPLLEKAVSISQAGADTVTLAISVGALASVYCFNGDTIQALPTLDRAMALWGSISGRFGEERCLTMNALGLMNQRLGRVSPADSLLAQSIQCLESVGGRHPLVGRLYIDRAIISLQRGDLPRALEYARRGLSIQEANLEEGLRWGSEDEAAAYLKTMTGGEDAILSLLSAMDQDAAVARLAVETVLNRKGQLLDAVAGATNTLRDSPLREDRELLERLLGARRDLATTSLRLLAQGLDLRSDDVLVRRAELDQLQLQAQRHCAELHKVPHVTLEAVRQGLPPGGVLLEYCRFRRLARGLPTDSLPPGQQPEHYGVFAVGPAGPVRWLDLGPAEPVDRAIELLRAAMTGPQATPEERRESTRSLYDLLLLPVAAPLAGRRHVVIAPDDRLNLVPFGALLDSQGNFLLERALVSYTASGRDLAPGSPRALSPGPAVVVAAPDFGPPTAWRGGRFEQLPGTAVEGAEVARLLGASLMAEGDAAEGALKNLVSPRFLHIASHGFFLPSPAVSDTTHAGKLRSLSERMSGARYARLLVQAGIALQGANMLQSGEEDGVLTALELAGMDLRATELVTLSACETGIGEPEAGEGVYGLRRAVALAGAHSQLVSLWPIDDRATVEMMTVFYRGILAGKDRVQALQDAQRAMMDSPDWSDPQFWASFILIGEWGRIQGIGNPPPGR